MRTRFLFLVIGLLVLSQWRTWLYYIAPPPDFSQGKVLLYATDWCPYCEKTRRLLKTKHIPYQEYNIETSDVGREQYQRLDGRGVPVLLVAGEVIRGYHEQQIKSTLDAWQARQAKKN